MCSAAVVIKIEVEPALAGADSPAGAIMGQVVGIQEASASSGKRAGSLDPRSRCPAGAAVAAPPRLDAAHHDCPSIAEALLAWSPVFPEMSLLTRLETGAIDAAMVYENMAVQRELPYRSLPVAVDLGSPVRRAAYRKQTYVLPEGKRVTGDVIEYAVTLRRRDDAARQILRAVLDADLLTAYGFAVPAQYPRWGRCPTGPPVTDAVLAHRHRPNQDLRGVAVRGPDLKIRLRSRGPRRGVGARTFGKRPGGPS